MDPLLVLFVANIATAEAGVWENFIRIIVYDIIHRATHNTKVLEGDQTALEEHYITLKQNIGVILSSILLYALCSQLVANSTICWFRKHIVKYLVQYVFNMPHSPPEKSVE